VAGERALEGLRVAIGGASHGVGAACAAQLGQSGARLFLCARNERDLEEHLRALRASGIEAHGLARDLSTDAGAADFALGAHARLGGVDLGLICAGVSQRPALLLDQDRAKLLAQFEGNAIAPALAAIALARAWSGPQARGQILVLSSLVTRRPAARGVGPYSAAKSALESLVRTLAEELWPRVRINALCLGPIATRMHEQAGTPREVREQLASADEAAALVVALLTRLAAAPDQPGLSGRCIDAGSFPAAPRAGRGGEGPPAPPPPPPPPPPAPPDAGPGAAAPGRPPSPRVRRAMRESASALHRYPRELHALTRRLAGLHRVDPSCVLLSGGGATELLERTLAAVGASGDEVVSPFPTFEVLSALASRLGLRHRPVFSRRGPDGLFLPHEAGGLLRAVGPRTRAVYVATPDNPTGALLSAAEERALREQLGPRIALILDEAWSLTVAGDETEPALGALGSPLDAPLVRLRSLSKLHGLAGLRVGYALASPELAALLRRLEPPFPLGAPQIAAARAALDELPRARRIARLLQRKRARLAQGIRALGLLASEGNSPLILVRDPKPGTNAGRLLFALRAAELPAQEAHWDPAAFTLSVGTPAQDRRALAALARAVG